MSIRIMAQVWDDPYFTAESRSKLLVALALADFARDDGKCWPSIETVARKARVSIRAVQVACQQMEVDGKLRRIVRKGDDSRSNQTNLYQFTLGGVVQPLHQGGCNDGTAVAPKPLGTVKEDKNPAHAEFISEWTSAYTEHFGEEYAFQNGKDAKAVKLLLGSSKKTPSELLRIAKAAWKHGGFFSKSSVSICGFNSKFNEIRQELNATHQKHPTESGRNTGTANEGRSSQYAGVGKVR